MTLNLIVARGAHEGEVIPIRKFPFVVGRNKGCHLHAASEFVSRRHCEITLQDDKFQIADLDSTNGTFLNGQAIKEQELGPGDRILVGPLEFVVDLETGESAHEWKPEPEKKSSPERVDEEAIADFLLAQEGEDDEGSGEDTTEKNRHPSSAGQR
jgi:pSer/pThr/pTyr-binding forkhead associated (FHA) protein